MPTAGQKASAMRAAKKCADPMAMKGKGKSSMPDEDMMDHHGMKKMAEAKKGMGFKAAAKAAAKSAGVSAERGAAIVAAGRAKASKKAVAANPNLKKVPTKGSHQTKGGTFKK